MNRIPYFVLLLFLLSSCGVLRPRTISHEIPGSEDPELLQRLPLKAATIEMNLQTKLVQNYKLNERALPYPHPIFYPVTSPYQKMRNDVKGDGFFGASRGNRMHNGLDIIITPGSAVYSPIEGVLFRKAYPYGTAHGNEEWEGLVIVGVGDYKGYEVKIFYTRPFVIGDYVFPGDIVGVAQDISRKYSPAMIDHVHVEVRRNGMLIDPATLLQLIE
jgi:murein DD-endopeptidase MepM/ murein hydrolase activator NlpD